MPEKRKVNTLDKIKSFCKKNKSLVFLMLLGLVVIVGGTYAYFTSRDTKENVFKTSKYDVKLDEDFDPSSWPDATKKEVVIKNAGTADVFIRMSYNETWVNDAGSVLNNLYNGESVVTKTWASPLEDDWVYHDGWYYYKKILSGGTDLPLLNSIALNKTLIQDSPDQNKYLTYNYELSFNYESVQATSDAVSTLWGHTVTVDGTNVSWTF